MSDNFVEQLTVRVNIIIIKDKTMLATGWPLIKIFCLEKAVYDIEVLRQTY
jgi:hypothetical protein